MKNKNCNQRNQNKIVRYSTKYQQNTQDFYNLIKNILKKDQISQIKDYYKLENYQLYNDLYNNQENMLKNDQKSFNLASNLNEKIVFINVKSPKNLIEFQSDLKELLQNKNEDNFNALFTYPKLFGQISLAFSNKIDFNIRFIKNTENYDKNNNDNNYVLICKILAGYEDKMTNNNKQIDLSLNSKNYSYIISSKVEDINEDCWDTYSFDFHDTETSIDDNDNNDYSFEQKSENDTDYFYLDQNYVNLSQPPKYFDEKGTQKGNYNSVNCYDFTILYGNDRKRMLPLYLIKI